MCKILIPEVKPKILVVGDAMMDTYWFTDVERISPEAPVAVAKLIGEPEIKLGGAANVALNLRQLGAECGILSCIGQDELGKYYRSVLRKNQINDHSVEIDDFETIEKIRIVSRGQQLLRVDKEGNLPELDNKIWEKFSEIINQYELIIFSDYDKGVLNKIENMIHLCNINEKRSFVDPKSKSFKRYKGAFLIKPNLSELKAAMSTASSQELNDADINIFLKDNNNKYLLLTKSREGVSLYNQDTKLFQQKSHAKEIYDVTGAGDTVIAVLVYLIAIGYGIPMAAKVANLAASIVVARLGTSSVTIAEINDILEDVCISIVEH